METKATVEMKMPTKMYTLNDNHHLATRERNHPCQQILLTHISHTNLRCKNTNLGVFILVLVKHLQ